MPCSLPLGIWQDLYQRLPYAIASLRGHFEKGCRANGATVRMEDSTVTKQKMMSMSSSPGQGSRNRLKRWPSTRLTKEEENLCSTSWAFHSACLTPSGLLML